MEKLKILLLDDELEVLKALTRLFRKSYDVHAYTSAKEALHAIEETEFALIISDMKMPVMTGDVFLQHACEKSPETPRLLLTGYSDINSTARAINKGKISNYISKPWNNDELRLIVAKAVEHFQLKKSVVCLEQELHEKNTQLSEQNKHLESLVDKRTHRLKKMTVDLKKSGKKQRLLLQDMIEMINLIIEDNTGDSKGHVKRVAAHCRLVAEHMELSKQEISQSYLSGLMHEIGKVSINDHLVTKSENNLNRAQLTQRQQNALRGAAILSKVPHLDTIALIIKHQYEWYNGSGFPERLKQDDIPVASQILAVVNDYDKLLIGRATGNDISIAEAQQKIKQLANRKYNPRIVDGYFSVLDHIIDQNTDSIDVCIGVELLEEGMFLSHDILNKQGAVMLTKGTELSSHLIEKLSRYQDEANYIFNIFVH